MLTVSNRLFLEGLFDDFFGGDDQLQTGDTPLPKVGEDLPQTSTPPKESELITVQSHVPNNTGNVVAQEPKTTPSNSIRVSPVPGPGIGNENIQNAQNNTTPEQAPQEPGFFSSAWDTTKKVGGGALLGAGALDVYNYVKQKNKNRRDADELNYLRGAYGLRMPR